jgi:hypothetical protein
MNVEFLDAVRQLADAVRSFLDNDDGCDDAFIEAMEIVNDVVERAQAIPALRDWALARAGETQATGPSENS